MGGTGAIVKGLVGLLKERGVPLRCNAPVVRIRIEDGRVIDSIPPSGHIDDTGFRIALSPS
jgi:phytoene dehydrogenase-like protein